QLQAHVPPFPILLGKWPTNQTLASTSTDGDRLRSPHRSHVLLRVVKPQATDLLCAHKELPERAWPASFSNSRPPTQRAQVFDDTRVRPAHIHPAQVGKTQVGAMRLLQ